MSGSRRPEKSAATDAASSDEAAGLQPDPAVSASWLSFVFFMYVTPLVNKAKNVGITLDDVWRSEATRSHEHYTHFTQIWARRREQSPDNVGVFRVFVEMFWKRFLIAHSMYLLRVVHQVSLPIIIRQVRVLPALVTITCLDFDVRHFFAMFVRFLARHADHFVPGRS